jgi:hypothetical protein
MSKNFAEATKVSIYLLRAQVAIVRSRIGYHCKVVFFASVEVVERHTFHALEVCGYLFIGSFSC